MLQYKRLKLYYSGKQKYRTVTRRVARNSQWGGGCFGGLGALPPAAKGQWVLEAAPLALENFCIVLQK